MNEILIEDTRGKRECYECEEHTPGGLELAAVTLFKRGVGSEEHLVRAHKDGSYSCTCAGWRFSKEPRKCKHTSWLRRRMTAGQEGQLELFE